MITVKACVWIDEDNEIPIIVFATEDEILEQRITGGDWSEDDFDAIEKIAEKVNDTDESCEDYILFCEEDDDIEKLEKIVQSFDIELDDRIKDCGWS